VKGWGDSTSAICVEKILETIHSTYLGVVYLLYMYYFKLFCVNCCLVVLCIVVIVLCVMLSPNVFMCTCATCVLLFLL